MPSARPIQDDHSNTATARSIRRHIRYSPVPPPMQRRRPARRRRRAQSPAWHGRLHAAPMPARPWRRPGRSDIAQFAAMGLRSPPRPFAVHRHHPRTGPAQPVDHAGTDEPGSTGHHDPTTRQRPALVLGQPGWPAGQSGHRWLLRLAARRGHAVTYRCKELNSAELDTVLSVAPFVNGGNRSNEQPPNRPQHRRWPRRSVPGPPQTPCPAGQSIRQPLFQAGNFSANTSKGTSSWWAVGANITTYLGSYEIVKGDPLGRSASVTSRA